MIQHKIVACKCRRKRIERACEKMGMENYRYRGDFFSRFLCIFSRHYLIFARPAEEGVPAVETEQDVNRRGFGCIATGAVAAALELIAAILFIVTMKSTSGSGVSVAIFLIPLALFYHVALIFSIIGLVRARTSELGKGLRIDLPVAMLVLCNVTMVIPTLTSLFL